MDFNKIKAIGLEYAEKGKNAAMDLAEKGKTQALLVNEQGKLLKAQRQLGALVYSLAKGKRKISRWWINTSDVDTIEQEITPPEGYPDPGRSPPRWTRSPRWRRKKLPPGTARPACPQDLPAVRRARLGRCAVLQ